MAIAADWEAPDAIAADSGAPEWLAIAADAEAPEGLAIAADAEAPDGSTEDPERGGLAIAADLEAPGVLAADLPELDPLRELTMEATLELLS